MSRQPPPRQKAAPAAGGRVGQRRPAPTARRRGSRKVLAFGCLSVGATLSVVLVAGSLALGGGREGVGAVELNVLRVQSVPSAAGALVYVEVVVSNAGDESTLVGAGRFSVLDGLGGRHAYDPTIKVDDDQRLKASLLDPGEATRGVLAFEVPRTDAGMTLDYADGQARIPL